jgi:hypothetical protein
MNTKERHAILTKTKTLIIPQQYYLNLILTLTALTLIRVAGITYITSLMLIVRSITETQLNVHNPNPK